MSSQRYTVEFFDLRVLMKRFALFSVLFLWMALVNGQQELSFDVSEWKRVEALDQSCQIFAPRVMNVRVDSTMTDIGEVMTVHHIIQQSTEESPNFMFRMSYTRYPRGIITLDSIGLIDDVLRTTVENSVLALGGELIYNADMKYKDLPGKIWKIKYGEGQYFMKSKAFIDTDKLYLVQVATLAEFAANRAVDHFFDSFKVTTPSVSN